MFYIIERKHFMNKECGERGGSCRRRRAHRVYLQVQKREE